MDLQSESALTETEGFSILAGGPLYQFLLRVGLVKPPLDRTGMRILLISTLAWVPLILLALLNGRLLSGVKIPFLYDFEVNVRLLVSIPLLIAAEVIVHNRMKAVLSQFLERQIVTPVLKPRFEEILASAMRLRNSNAVEFGLIIFVLLGGGLMWRALAEMQSDTWYATATSGGAVRTPAGNWYQFVSVPIAQIIMFRWYFRIFVWARLLRQISKLDLNLVATHPDAACGLSFLGGIVVAMMPILVAHSCLLSGSLANRILHEGAKLPDYYVEIGALALFMFLLALGPLCVFTPSLLRAKRLGLHKYGRLASDYVMGFDRKWIEGQRSSEEPLVGTGDIQSLADMANSFAIVRSITPFAFGRQTLIGLAVIIALPLLPLGLTMFSPQELILRLLKVLI